MLKTKSLGKRNVLLLLAMAPLLATTKHENKSKPAIYKLYNFSKGEQILLIKEWDSTAVNRIKVVDYECIFVRFGLMSSERQHDICNEQ